MAASALQSSHSRFEIEYDSASMQSHNPKTRKPREVVGRDGEDGGVFLTWEDLWVTVSNGKSGSRSILQGLTGYARPGEVLAIMGPSGCGKSTLLDALAGRLGSNTSQSGIILVNGHKQALSYGTSAYVTQDDTLITTLTVGEAVYYSALLQLPDSMSKSEKKERADMTIREMGLQDAINTRIGGWGVKGISGGQKRRVSICIEILTHPKLLFLDEPTSGLDSAASYYVMSRIARLDRQQGRTIITSIHQPSSEVFALFDNLCLLSSGRTVYFGPAHAADEDIEQGFGGKKSKEEAIDILTKAYKSSDNFQQVQTQVSEIYKQDGGALKKRSHASFLNQCLVLTRRSFVNMYRDLGYYWLRLAIYVALTVALGTIFHNVGYSNSSIKDRGAMLMYVASFLTFMSIGGFPSFVEDMKVFGRERLNGHYGSSSFVVGNTLSSVPYLLVISLIPGAIAYFLTGLQKEYAHFIYYALVLFTCMMLVESLMMIVASVVPNFLMGIITGAGIQGLLILGGGFFRLPNDLPNVFWRYPLYYISFNRYAYQGLYKNEFLGLTFPSNIAGGPRVTGEEVLRETWQMEMAYSKWVDLSILIGMVVLYRFLFFIIIKTTEKVIPTVKAFMSRPPKQTKQVMANPFATPSATPLHGASI
ncbi:ABC transporter G family member 11-like isoform X2 [Vitis riparia]|uniref:ABC transporter G family member 11-like isoform X2 n=1 Tax=Vitis riparia TaxID=96939 RepID=UPI00155AB089|nr:ABC transporter G family member 11-like isoform X2 [Vitis riparia]